jgi:hypothetical protein
LFPSSQKYDPGCSSLIRIPDPDFYPSRIPFPGIKKAPEFGSATLSETKYDFAEIILRNQAVRRLVLQISFKISEHILTYGTGTGFVKLINKIRSCFSFPYKFTNDGNPLPMSGCKAAPPKLTHAKHIVGQLMLDRQLSGGQVRPGNNTLHAALWNRNYFLRFRFRLLKSYGSGSNLCE